jgi:uncharacterized membrane protein YfcA
MSASMPLFFALIGFVYASVGHGGASGYLALCALLGQLPGSMAEGALALNLLVAGMAWAAFCQAGHGSPRLLGPFLLGSVPAACLGGWLPVSAKAYHALLGLTLCAAAVRLCLPAKSASWPQPPPPAVAILVGAGLGLLSGIVGVGGGIFLSPLLLLRGWASPHQTAAASAGFIVVNSAAGLAGRALAGRFDMGPMGSLAVGALVGGAIGSYCGSRCFAGVWLRRLLAAVLVIAAGKLLAPAFGRVDGLWLSGVPCALIAGAMLQSVVRRPRCGHG